MATTEREINEFLERYPDDPRAAKVARIPRRDRAGQGGAQAAARGPRRIVRSDHCCPSERLYLQAVIPTATAPDAALSMLQSLVDLYGRQCSGTRDATGLPRRGSSEWTESRTPLSCNWPSAGSLTLQNDIAKQRDAQLAEIQERLERRRD